MKSRLDPLLLVVLIFAFPTFAKQPPAEFARYMFGHLNAPIVDCPQEIVEQQAPKAVICAGYAASFGIFKSDWELSYRRHDLPDGVSSLSHWTLSGGRYIRDYKVHDLAISFLFDDSNGRLIAAYLPGDDIDTDAPAPDEELRRAPLEAGFGGVTIPKLIPESRVEPLYPAEARELGLAGSVTLSLIIHEDGGVGEVTVLAVEPAGIGFEEAALRAVRQWRYEPALHKGAPVEVRYTVYVDFEPDGGP